MLKLLLRFGDFLLRRVWVDDALVDHRAGFVQHGDFAPRSDAGVDGENPLAAQRRTHQQTAQVAGENIDRVVLGVFGQFTANFPFETRHHQPAKGVLHDRVQHLPVRVILQRKVVDRNGLHFRRVPFQLQANDVLPFAAIDGKNPVRRDDANGFFELVVVAVFQSLAFGNVVRFVRDEFSRVPHERPQRPAHVGHFRDDFGEDVLDPGEYVVNVVELLPRIDDAFQHLVERFSNRVAGPDGQREWFKTLLTSVGRQRAFLHFVRQVQVVEPLHVFGG